MSRDETLFEQIRALRPDDDGWAGSDEGRNVMTRAQQWTGVADHGVRRRGGRTVVAGVVAGGLMVGGGAAAAMAFFTADSPTQAGCYSAMSPQADTIEASSSLVAEVGATQACRQTWREVGDDVDTRNLVSCVNEHGGRGVFPARVGMTARAACGGMGWSVDRP